LTIAFNFWDVLNLLGYPTNDTVVNQEQRPQDKNQWPRIDTDETRIKTEAKICLCLFPCLIRVSSVALLSGALSWSVSRSIRYR
jgi:hypothetical protein